MENKSNDATPQRPEGNRILNAPLVDMSLQDSMKQLRSESTWKDSDRNSLAIFKSDTLRIVLLGLHEKAELAPHKVNGVITVQVLEGSIKFITDEKSTVRNKGEMLALHENIVHSVVALEESFFLLTIAMIKD